VHPLGLVLLLRELLLEPGADLLALDERVEEPVADDELAAVAGDRDVDRLLGCELLPARAEPVEDAVVDGLHHATVTLPSGAISSVSIAGVSDSLSVAGGSTDCSRPVVTIERP
jgi:hypothetical protein